MLVQFKKTYIHTFMIYTLTTAILKLVLYNITLHYNKVFKYINALQ